MPDPAIIALMFICYVGVTVLFILYMNGRKDTSRNTHNIKQHAKRLDTLEPSVEDLWRIITTIKDNKNNHTE